MKVKESEKERYIKLSVYSKMSEFGIVAPEVKSGFPVEEFTDLQNKMSKLPEDKYTSIKHRIWHKLTELGL